MAVQTAQKNVRQAVVVKIPQGHAAPIAQHPVGGEGALIQRVDEGDPGLFRREQRETGPALRRHLQFRPPESLFLMP